MCIDCDLSITHGGTCRGLIKNPEAKVPFYVCPRAEDLQRIREYYDKAATKRTFFTASHSLAAPPIPCARESSQVKVGRSVGTACRL